MHIQLTLLSVNCFWPARAERLSKINPDVQIVCVLQCIMQQTIYYAYHRLYCNVSLRIGTRY